MFPDNTNNKDQLEQEIDDLHQMIIHLIRQLVIARNSLPPKKRATSRKSSYSFTSSIDECISSCNERRNLDSNDSRTSNPKSTNPLNYTGKRVLEASAITIVSIPPYSKVPTSSSILGIASPNFNTSRLPPIYIKNEIDYAPVVAAFERSNIMFEANSTDGKVKFSIKDEAQFRLAYQILKKNYVEFHSSAEKHMKVIIKGLPVDVSEDVIAEDLREQNFEIIRVSRMKRGVDRHPISRVLVELVKPSNGMDIFKVDTIFCLQVKVEAYRKKCYCCQQFEHTKYLKCARNHFSFEMIGKTAKCANCAGSTNFRGCR